MSKAGYEVHILNSVYSKVLLIEDLALLGNYNIGIEHISDLTKKDLWSFFDRLCKKVGNLLIKYFGFETQFALGYAPLRYIDVCKKINANLYICHQELPVFLGGKLLRLGYNVAFDLEDWHSEDLPVRNRYNRAVRLLRSAENIALNHGAFCTVTSIAMAKQLAEVYSSKVPQVIYNTFNLNLKTLGLKKEFNEPIRLVWFSLNIGHGRGLEEFINILAHITTTVELHLIGAVTDDYKQEITGRVPSLHKIFFHEMVKADMLDEKLSSFDIGLATELKTPLNRNCTITNKFFQYIQNGLPIIATNTLGNLEILKQYQVGLLIDFEQENHILLNKFLNDLPALKKMRENAISAAKFYNWENQQHLFLELIKKNIQIK
ncbi:glycosyltransferase [Pedobacter frigidisoli]|uniref:Glycosyltransferase n=1 Tax=Pedobacter frigidisoli TaxID=2530455 RepID=A0A4R0P269_9SPHI|nr:glycosyltransferase [Pedobacter frigidisoli]TCD07717.1 glycosyltransferase [Pedobacter frigidisoli]